MYLVGEADSLRKVASTPCLPINLITPSEVETCLLVKEKINKLAERLFFVFRWR
jgi:hypothetical protein